MAFFSRDGKGQIINWPLNSNSTLKSCEAEEGLFGLGCAGFCSSGRAIENLNELMMVVLVYSMDSGKNANWSLLIWISFM